jgi:hypothetical protein
VITLKKAYLSTLDVGNVVFTVKFTKDNDVTLTIIVEDTTDTEE